MLQDHTPLYLAGDWAGLRLEMESRGYLRIRQLHRREAVMAARTGGDTSSFLNIPVPSLLLHSCIHLVYQSFFNPCSYCN